MHTTQALAAATPHSHVARSAQAQDWAQWLHALTPQTLRTDSRRVRAGDVFIAWPGAAHDGRDFIEAAFAQGAVACVVEAHGLEARYQTHSKVLAVPGLKAQLGLIAAAYYDHPAAHMALTAITGTNGKTSSAWWLAHAWQALAPAWQQRCGVVGTLGAGPVDALAHTGLTTPDPVTLHIALRHMQQQGVSACALEASSIGLVEQRLAGLDIRHAVFTNLTQDHLDYHGDLMAYQAAKAQLFAWPNLSAAVINVDDAFGAVLAQACLARGVALWTCSVQAALTQQAAPARLVAHSVLPTAQGTRFTLTEHAAHGAIHTAACDIAAVGDFNVRNILGVIAVLRASHVPLAAAAAAVRRLPAVPGRLELVAQADKPWVLVDYAHTPDAVAQVLRVLRPLAAQRQGKLWCVLGCGGNRDASKRAPMGAAAAAAADYVVVTSDNPRDEEPAHIAQAVFAGAQQVLDGAHPHGAQHTATVPQASCHAALGPGAMRITQILDRQAAIAFAIAQAAASDVVLLAGKGHETSIEEKGHNRPFDDRAWARHYLSQWRPMPGAHVPLAQREPTA